MTLHDTSVGVGPFVLSVPGIRNAPPPLRSPALLAASGGRDSLAGSGPREAFFRFACPE